MTSLRILLSNLINLVVAVVSFFLIARISLKLFAANPATPFVSFIYDFSSSLMAPFQNIFSQAFVGSSVLDIPALFALAIYLVIGYLLVAFVATVTLPYYHRHIHTEEI